MKVIQRTSRFKKDVKRMKRRKKSFDELKKVLTKFVGTFFFSASGLRSGFGVRDSGFGIRGSGFGVRDSGFGIRDSGFGVRGSGFGGRLSTAECPD